MDTTIQLWMIEWRTRLDQKGQKGDTMDLMTASEDQTTHSTAGRAIQPFSLPP
jgi:hypothetical protein